MENDLSDANSSGPFASMADLKNAHSELLKLYRQDLGIEVHHDDAQRLEALLPRITNFLARGRMTGQVIDAENERTASQAYLDYWVSVIYRSGLTRDDKLHHEATLEDFNPELAPEIPESRCPYIGLDAFQEQDKAIFCGRKMLVGELLSTIETQPILAVVGPSGSGKSSAVLAGLLPELKAGGLPGSEDWNYYAPIVPSANPLRSLALSLRPKSEPVAWVDEQVERLKRDPGQLRKLFDQASSSPAVLVVDQFEEVFTLCNDEEVLQAFINNLLNATEGATVHHRVITTMRIEFQEQMPRLEKFYPLFLRGLVQVLPLSVIDLREAIEKPAAEVGLKFEQGIVDSLVKEIVGEPAGLPLLQFTLLELWRRRRRNRVLLADYNKLGGARKALTNVATEFYTHLQIQEQEIVKSIFLRLAWTGESVEVLRNRVSRRALIKAGGSSDRVNAVLRKLVAARLIRLTRDEFAVGDSESPNDQFEVAHEALIRNWQLLIDWLQANRETLRHRIRVRSAAEQWKAHERDPGGLLGGSLLVDAAKYTDLDDLEKEFIKASKDAEQAATDEREEIRLREFNQLQALAAAERLSVRRLRVLVGVLIGALLANAGITAYALWKRSDAVQAYQSATKAIDELTKQQQVVTKANDETAKALAEAEAANKKLESAQNTLVEKNAALDSQAKELDAKAKELDKKNAALRKETQDKDKAIKAAQENYLGSIVAQNDLTKNLNQISRTNERYSDALSNVTSFSNDGSKLIGYSPDGTTRVWDTKSGEVIRQTTNSDQDRFFQSHSSALSPNGKYLVTTLGGAVKLIDLESGDERSLETDNLGARLVFSGDSTKLALLDQLFGTAVEVIDIEKRESIGGNSDSGADQEIVGMALSNDGKQIALTTVQGETELLSLEPNNKVTKKIMDGGAATCLPAEFNLLSFSPSPNLKATLKMQIACVSETASTDGLAAANKGLTAQQAAKLLGPAQSDTPRPNSNTAEVQPVDKVSVRPATKDKKIPTYRIVLDVYRRNSGAEDKDNPFADPFVQLCFVDYKPATTDEIIESYGTLAKEGLSENNVRYLSDAINNLTKEIDQVPGNDQDPAKQAKLQKITLAFFRQMMAQLKLPYEGPRE